MVKKKDEPTVISENDRLKLQLLNSVLDRAQVGVENARVRMENAKLSSVIAQRELDVADSDLRRFGKELEDKYCFSMTTDSVDWTTGTIRRGSNAEE